MSKQGEGRRWPSLRAAAWIFGAGVFLGFLMMLAVLRLMGYAGL